MFRNYTAVALAMVTLFGAATAASAQSSRRDDGGWMFEIHGSSFGEVLDLTLPGSWGNDGKAIDSFPTGEVFPAGNVANGVSRAVPSWVFGDGARLYEETRRLLAVRPGNPVSLPAIVPLDGVMRSRGTTRTPATAFGARFSRNLFSWLAAEVAVDRGAMRTRLDDSVAAGVEATRASYVAAFTQTAAFIDPVRGGRVASIATLPAAVSGNQTVVTGSAVLSLVRTSRLGIHALLGGGVVRHDSDAAMAVTLQSSYAFDSLPVTIDERESVTVRFAQKKSAPVAVAGLGVTLRLAGRSGLRADARILAVKNTATTAIDVAAPTVGSRGSVTFGQISPTMRFGTNDQDRPSLSGAPINGLITYTDTGRDLRPQFSVGYYIRF